MTPELMPRPAGAVDRVRWTLVDGWTLVRRELAHLTPGELAAQLLAPGVLVLLFGYVFGSAITVPGGGNYREYLMPGLFVMTSITGVMATAITVAGDKDRGVMDRFRSMPMAKLAVPFGQTGAVLLTGTLSTAGIAVCGLAVGWRAHHGLARALAAFGLLLLLRYALSWGGVLLGLALSERTVDQAAPLIFPVTMLSNAFVPTTGMPAWLRTLCDWNPVSALVAACRNLFGNQGAPAGQLAWPLQHPVAMTLLSVVVLLVAFVPLTVRRFQTMNR